MKIIKDVDKMKTHAKIVKKDNRLVGLVPTMGYFHEGHLSLMKAAKKQSDFVITSVFVNPIQFGPGEDFEKYPRDIRRDEELAKTCGVDVLFCPSEENLYPSGFSTYVQVEKLTERLCGKSRPLHFRGVTTVITKLLEIVRPDIVYFGQKDAQQAFVIRKMIEDLNMGITMKMLPTVREQSGLAMSSRNKYLTKSEKKDATILYKSLELAGKMADSGEREVKKITKAMKDLIAKIPSVKIEYISIVDMKLLQKVTSISGEVLVALAAFIGKTRLIDNIILNGKDG